MALLIGAVLLGTTFVAGVLGYRDHRHDGSASAAPVSTSAPSTTAAAQAPPTTCRQPTGIAKVPGKPTDIPVPAKPVTALQIRDLKVGQGKAATTGDKLNMQYVGISCASGRQFDASWDRNKQPLPLTLGAGDVIPGWDQGIKGMKVGGRRLLWIPASLGYGGQGRPPDIAPGDTLIFVVDLVKIG